MQAAENLAATDCEQQNSDSELGSGSSNSGSPAVSATSWIEALIAKDAKTLEAAFKKVFSCYSCTASYKVNSEYGSITERSRSRRTLPPRSTTSTSATAGGWRSRPSSRASSRRTSNSST